MTRQRVPGRNTGPSRTGVVILYERVPAAKRIDTGVLAQVASLASCACLPNRAKRPARGAARGHRHLHRQMEPRARWCRTCQLSDVPAEFCQAIGAPSPDPASDDTATNDYVFERGVKRRDAEALASTLRIDLYKRGAFILEAKQSPERLRRCHCRTGPVDRLSSTAIPQQRRTPCRTDPQGLRQHPADGRGPDPGRLSGFAVVSQFENQRSHS